MSSRRFIKYLRTYWRPQAVVMLLGMVTVPLNLLNPYLTKLVIDRAYGNKDLRLFFILAIIGASSFVLIGLINSLRGYLSERIGQRVHFDITTDLFKHLQSLPLAFFDNHSTGGHIHRLDRDTSNVGSFLCCAVPEMISSLPRLLFILPIVFYLNWRLALLSLLLVPATYIHPYFFGRRMRDIDGQKMERADKIFENLQEVFSHIRLVKALGRERYEIKKFEENTTGYMNLELKNARISNIGSFSGSVLSKLISGGIALYGGYQVIKGTMTLGSLTASMIYLTQLVGLLRSAGLFYQTALINKVSRRRLTEILDTRPEITAVEDSLSDHNLGGRIEFRDVSFGYEESKFILKGINFSIGQGSKIAVAGPSGCGKTTLLNLILRLYEVKEGSILIDGLDLREIRLQSLKRQIGIALQEPFLWNDTAANNILYGAEDATREDMLKAARLAKADEFIMDFPDGYDSVIGEMACKISEGQKQRIAIARAVIRRPKILILDETLSSVDSETEDKIIDNLITEFKTSTVIIVSHRFSTVRKMNLVYFLESPSGMRIATPRELAGQNSKYPGLFTGQFGA